ncbi:2-oxo acid dehydrogenase subunit E2 [Candidatus Woesearchaeota archaeon]|nr:2-oxo acid dehydrogenase subunit E2 [Candidatus Woesearchaeota archaeon]
MAYEFRFPDVGEGITEGSIVKWRVKEGSNIKKDQVIAEIETDKAVAEIPSPVAGKVLKIRFKEGETIKVGEVLIIIDDGSAANAGKKETDESNEFVKEQQKNNAKDIKEIKTTAKAQKIKKSVGVVGELEEDNGKTHSSISSRVDIETPKIRVTLFVRKLAQALNVDISKIKGTGNNGLITEDDVKNAVQPGNLQGSIERNIPDDQNAEPDTNKEKTNEVKPVRKYDMFGYIDRVLLKGIRKITAKHMIESENKAVHVTHIDEADISNLDNIREREKINAEKKGTKLTFLPYVMKACVDALKKHPYLNASIDEENNDILLKKYYNIGFAVDTEDGLIVPVMKGADQKNVFDIAKEIGNLSEQARTRKIDLFDLKGGTFTITNIGSIGGLYATPIINFPESAILGLGRAYDKPVVVNGKIEIRKVLPFSLSFDHRILDGAEAARFANDMKKVLEEANF